MRVTRAHGARTAAPGPAFFVHRPGARDTMVRPLPARVCTAVVVAAVLPACATNPVTGRREFTLMSQAQEVAIGRQLDAEVRREMGLYEDAALQQYVDAIGQRLARVSHRPDLEWHFAVVDQPAVNAFALPGGYVYLTRGILPFLADEAELAGVLGHEIGHVTARHAAQQYTKATTGGLGLAVLGILVPETRPFQQVAETALGVLFLKYSREDELEADRLGAEYAAKGGWDPGGVAGMLATLARLDEASGQRRGVPNWLSTHPAPAERVERLRPAVAGRGGATDRETFLRRFDGLVYGDSPDQGVVRGHEFLHAALRFALDFPRGWEITNAPAQVTAKAPEAEAYVLLQLVQNARGPLDEVAVESMGRAGFRLREGRRATINGLEAVVGTYEGRLPNIGPALARAAHIAHGGRVYLVAGLAGRELFPRVARDFGAAIESFRPLSRAEAAAIRPNRIDLYTVAPGDTWESIARRTGGLIRPSTLAIMNQHEPGDPPRAGERIKVVVAG